MRRLRSPKIATCPLRDAIGAVQQGMAISLPLVGMLFIPKIAVFQRLYPEIELDIDCSERLVEVIEEGFYAVIRSGESSDLRLMARTLGSFRQTIIGAPGYFQSMGTPQEPEDLLRHTCLLYRFPTTGKFLPWPFSRDGQPIDLALPAGMVSNTLEPQLCFAEQGLGLVCVPDYAVRRQLENGTLVAVLGDFIHQAIRVLWPSSRHLSPKLRVFVVFLAQNLFAD